MPHTDLFAEMKRREVHRVSAAYLAAVFAGLVPDPRFQALWKRVGL